MLLCLHIFGDVHVFLLQTITLWSDVCFLRIINERCRNIILSVHVIYVI